VTGAELCAAFFLQVFLILAVCWLVGWMSRKLGRPQAVGEMIAGVFMGLSLLGGFFPEIHKAVFPPESLKVLYVGEQLGVGLYMFLVAVEFNKEQFMSRARSAAGVFIAGIIAPLVLGAALAIPLMKVPGLFSEKATLFEAMLFLGASMAITAFPMLARIIYERGLTGTPLATIYAGGNSLQRGATLSMFGVTFAFTLRTAQAMPPKRMS